MATFKAQDINHKLPRIVDAGIFADIRYDANDAAPDYIGLNRTNGASQDDTDWKIYKFTYAGADVTRIQLAYGSWTGRVALF
jgi:hypothetical protein